MKTKIQHLQSPSKLCTSFKQSIVLLMAIFLFATGLRAQFGITNYTILHHFNGMVQAGDGYDSFSTLTPAGPQLPGIGGLLFGTLQEGGGPPYYNGMIFKISPNGKDYQDAYDFDGVSPGDIGPVASLLNVGGNLYGTCAAYSGSVFAFDPFFDTETDLTFFSPPVPGYTGYEPECTFVSASNTLFGTTVYGDVNATTGGTIFKINTDGTGYQLIYDFPDFPTNGATPECGVIIGQTNVIGTSTVYILYGTCATGGINGYGVVYSVKSDGTGYTVLHNFPDGNYASDGTEPFAPLILVGNVLYGTTFYGGDGSPDGNGIIFKINTDGSDYTILYKFQGANPDGSNPQTPLTYYNNELYGTANYPLGVGAGYQGVIYKIDLDGSNYTVLHDFMGYSDDGARPESPLALVKNIYGTYLYGTTYSGGTNNGGVIFVLPLEVTNPPFIPVIVGHADGSIVANCTNLDISVSVTNITNAAQVSIYADFTLLVAITNGPYSFIWTNPPTGDYTISAVAADTNGTPISASAINISSQPSIVTVAGKHSLGAGYSGDGGAATNADLYYPSSVALDSAGNFYIADTGNSLIRKVNTNGTITRVVGNLSIGGNYSGDGGMATNAALNWPQCVIMDPLGDFFIADTDNHVIRKVDTSGIITTVAGDNSIGGTYSGDGGLATSAALNYPFSIALDASGDLFIADTYNHVIREVDTNGIITTVAGDNSLGRTYSGDGGSATGAGLSYPCGITVDASGNLLIADTGNFVIRKVDVNGIITTVAGDNSLGGAYSGDGGPAINAGLNSLESVALDTAGNCYIADEAIRMINTNGIITTIAGNPNSYGRYSGDHGVATNAALNGSSSAVPDNVGNLYISDTYNNVIRFYRH